MSQNYEELLTQYAETRDADAFRRIVMQYKDMVYAACKRILRNAADAEDATQNCFFALARNPGKVRGSVAGWLHRAATGTSVDLIRRDSARRAREAGTVRNEASEESAAWEGISHALDAAINDLPDELRIPIIRCYLEGNKQEDAAREMGVSQSAVAKRLQRGVETLRTVLRKGGWMGSAALLTTLLGTRTCEAAPATLTASLGKLAIAGKAGAAGGVAGGTGVIGGLSVMKLAIVGLSVAVVAGIAVTVVVARSRPDAAPAGNPEPVVVQEEPMEEEAALAAADKNEEKPDPAEEFIREAIDAVFKAEDPQAMVPYFHPDAERKNRGKGTALRTLQGTPRDVLNRIIIKDMIFFTAQELPELASRYPNDMWGADRVPSRLDDEASACFVTFSIPAEGANPRERFWVCVAKKIDGKYKIVYWDDN